MFRVKSVSYFELRAVLLTVVVGTISVVFSQRYKTVSCFARVYLVRNNRLL